MHTGKEWFGMYSGIIPSGQKNVSHGLEGSASLEGAEDLEGSASLEGAADLEGSASLEGAEDWEGTPSLEGAADWDGSASLEGAADWEGSAGLGVGEQGTTMDSSNKIHSRSTSLPPFLHSNIPSEVSVAG